MTDKNFWLENFSALFSSFQIVPFKNQILEEQLNAITRLLLIVFVLMLLFNFSYSIHFLIISMIFIIIIYYIQKRTMKSKCLDNSSEGFRWDTLQGKTPVREFYGQPINMTTPINKGPYLGPTKGNSYNFPKNTQPYNASGLASNIILTKNGQKYVESTFDNPESRIFCNDEVNIDPPSDFAVSINQKLTGQANPKTLIAPLVVPPTHALDYWRENDLIVHSAINSAGLQEDMYLSGYAESTCCGFLNNGAELVPEDAWDRNSGSTENYTKGIVSPTPAQDTTYVPVLQRGTGRKENYKGCSSGCIISPQPVEDRVYVPVLQRKEGYCGSKGIVSPQPVKDRVYVPTLPTISQGPQQGKEMYTNSGDLMDDQDGEEDGILVRENGPGMVNTDCGYNPIQIERSGLPSNYPSGNCQQDPRMKRYNENLFTQIVTPGVYMTNQVNEPISSNIGISFQQQFEPVSCKRDEKGLHYTLLDPRIVRPVEPKKEDVIKPNYDNIYDPRANGEGTSYRSYYEPVTGQTRFYYDDIGAIKYPQYISRNKIDNQPFGETYGPIKQGSEFGLNYNANIRALANDAFLTDSLQFRDELSLLRMRKMASIISQRRLAPLGGNQFVHKGGKGANR